jgi:phospholipid/cholesterol/gamma-HCH transport system substrate-binding protein
MNENMEALQHNFLFRGYFKKKAKEEEKKRIEEENLQSTEIEIADEEK